jgi:hypothetical protein
MQGLGVTECLFLLQCFSQAVAAGLPSVLWAAGAASGHVVPRSALGRYTTTHSMKRLLRKTLSVCYQLAVFTMRACSVSELRLPQPAVFRNERFQTT